MTRITLHTTALLVSLVLLTAARCEVERGGAPDPSPTRNYVGCPDWRDGCPLQTGRQDPE